MTEHGKGIIDGLNDVIAHAQGDETRGRKSTLYSPEVERIAQTYVNCGDGAVMQFRFVLATGFYELSLVDDIQDNLSRADALAIAYRAIAAALSQPTEPDNG